MKRYGRYMFHIFVSQQTSRPDKFIGTAFEKDRTKPARASAFIGVSILSGADAPEGIVIPARASTFNCIDTVQNADSALAGIAIQWYQCSNERRSPRGLSFRRPLGPFGSYFLKIVGLWNVCNDKSMKNKERLPILI